MPEVALACQHHGKACLIGRLDHLVVAHGAAGLNHAGGASRGGLEQAVGKGEKRISIWLGITLYIIPHFIVGS